jgi:MoaA/NifB/PqqE/SkfB family radical SAM enzyme
MNRSAHRILRDHLTLKRAVNILKGLISYILSHIMRRPVLFGHPFMLMVEPSNLCNLNCPLCPTGSDSLTRPQGNMTLEQFKHLLDESSQHLLFLSLWNVGEPFMNPHLMNMIRYAKSRKLYVITSTNGHFFQTRQKVRDLIRSGLDELIVSIDGASPETYNRYRRKGDIHTVIEGLRLLTEEKAALASPHPLIDLQFIVMRHNEHEIETIDTLARQMKVNQFTLKTVQVTTDEEAQTFLPTRPELRRYHLQDGHIRMKGTLRNTCRWLWFCPVINWDGSVVPCCFDKDNDLLLGTLSNGTLLSDIWRGERYTRLRRTILTAREHIDLCGNCSEGLKSLYLKRVRIQ